MGAQSWLGRCAAAAALLLSVAPGSADDLPAADLYAPMSFTAGRAEGGDCGSSPPAACADFIVARGVITLDSSIRYLWRRKALGDRDLPVILESPGGNTAGMELLARMWRAVGATVVVAQAEPAPCKAQAGCGGDGVATFALASTRAVCASACPYALSGAVRRIAGRGAMIGLHRPFINLQTAAGRALVAGSIVDNDGFARDFTTRVAGMLGEMGVDPGLAERAYATPSAAMDWISDADARALGLFNGSATQLSAALAQALAPPSKSASVARPTP